MDGISGKPSFYQFVFLVILPHYISVVLRWAESRLNFDVYVSRAYAIDTTHLLKSHLF